MNTKDLSERDKVRLRRQERAQWAAFGRVAITVFVVWHLFALVVWALAGTSEVARQGMSIVRPYMTLTGLNQGWLMFAPEPYKLDVYVETVVHYADGSQRVWDYPRMDQLRYDDRYRSERYRKYIEVAHQEGFSYLWHSMATYAARINNDRPGSRPVSVDLIRHFRVLPDIQTTAPGAPPPPMGVYKFYSTDIQPEDLR
ncbi:hypothetical protein CCAX7_002120 [Capsulimonas corticalis]|uniref:Uncharacterized protein n=1 Tax=Capsulimonas corticalis TaxID=2219043 RepID=A0A402CRX3_9BACT|nr:hypothetical protein [Capsulimonas corticalis]BDI28161.1 hypothetical protein CCAX7_002120 [Capsulimonas corticalis]